MAITLDGTNGITTPALENDGVTTVAAGSASAPAITTDGDTNTGIFFPAADTIAFGEGGAEAMRINSSGNLLVGTTSFAGSAGRVISVKSDIAYAGQVSNSNGSVLLTYGPTDSYPAYFVNSSNSNAVGYIRVSASTTTFATSSDYRLKENIAPMTGALDKVAQLKPCTYTWKSTGEASQGFIAHELQAVVPDCVTGEKDAVDADGNPKYQGIDTSFLVATLTAAIQELSAKNDALEARIAALEGAQA
jgi:hypothetical protein